MEKVAQLKVQELPTVVFPTLAIFAPILEDKRAVITTTPRRSFKYGATERHKLDIYYPATPSPGKTPVLFFIYGGGFTSGDRIFPAPFDLLHANLGAFFSKRGFIVVIPDYRLTPEAKFPDSATDVRDAIEWVISHPEKLYFEGVRDPALDSIFVMGHSAGATHTFIAVALPELYSSTVHPKIKGIILIAGSYHFGPEVNLKEAILLYWGSEEEAAKKSPLAILEALTDDQLARLPDIALFESENEPESLRLVGIDFRETVERRLGKTVFFSRAAGHNHISMTSALSSGEAKGEEWTEKVFEYINNVGFE